MIRRWLMILGSVMLGAALLLAFFGYSDLAFVVAAAWLAVLAAALIGQAAFRRRQERTKAGARL